MTTPTPTTAIYTPPAPPPLYTFLHPTLQRTANVRIDTISTCGRYAKVVVMGFVEAVADGNDYDYSIFPEEEKEMDDAIGEDWNVAMSELQLVARQQP